MIYKIFPRLKVQPLSVEVKSRDGLIYLDQGMQVVGWVPPKNSCLKRIYAIWTFLTTVILLGWLPICFTCTYVKDLSSLTAGQFLTSMQVCVNTYGNTLKASYTFWGIKRFNIAKELLDRMDKRCTREDEQIEIRRIVAFWNLVYMVFQVSYSGYTTSTYLAASFNGRLPWSHYNPLIDSENGFTSFWMAATIEYILMSLAVLMDQCADVYTITYMGILRTHINFLKKRLGRLRTNPKMTEDENYQELVKCIEDHQLIMDYVDVLRPVISATIFVQFLLIGVVLGLGMINIMFFSDIWTGLATTIFLTCVLMETFPFCYICNIILDDCDELSQCLFHSNWFDANRRYRTAVLSFLHRIQQPIILTAGGIFPICMQTNITVAKLAFSVITVAKEMDIATKFQN